jgi:hypothetical protein
VVTVVTTVITVTPHDNATPQRYSRLNNTHTGGIRPSSDLSATAETAEGPVAGTALVRSGSGHVLIWTFANPLLFVPDPSALQKPRNHTGSFYCVVVGQECGIFPSWYVHPFLLPVSSLIVATGTKRRPERKAYLIRTTGNLLRGTSLVTGIPRNIRQAQLCANHSSMAHMILVAMTTTRHLPKHFQRIRL